MGDAKLPSYVGHASIGPLYIEDRFVTSSKRAFSSAEMTCAELFINHGRQNTLSLPDIAHAHYFRTRSPLPKSLAPTIFQNTPSSPEIAPAHYLGRSKVTLLSPTLSTQTQAEKSKGRCRTVTPPHISDKCVRKTWFHYPPNSPHSYLVGAKSPSPRKLPSPELRNLSPSSMAPPTAPISQSPSSLMLETLSICRRALGSRPGQGEIRHPLVRQH